MSEVATNIDVNIYYDKGEKEFDEFVKTKKYLQELHLSKN